MSLHDFRLLSPPAQLYWVLRHGTHLAIRGELKDWLNLYHCPGVGRGFFVEVGIAATGDHLEVRSSFGSAAPLADYAHQVRLPSEW